MKKLIFLGLMLFVSQANAMNAQCCPYPSLWQRMRIRTAMITNKIACKFNRLFSFGSSASMNSQQNCCVKRCC